MDIAAFRNIGNQGNLVVDNQQGDQSIRKANLFENVGAFFKTANSQARNADVLSHLKEAIAHEPKYFGVQAEAQEAMRALSIDKPIKASAIQDVLAKLDSLSTPKAQKAYVKQQFLQNAQQAHGNSDANHTFGLPSSLADTKPSVKAAYTNSMQRVCDKALRSGENLHSVDIDALRNKLQTMTDCAVQTSQKLPEASRDIFMKFALARQVPVEQMQQFADSFAQLASDPQISHNRLHEAAENLFVGIAGSTLKDAGALAETMTEARNKTFVDSLTPNSAMFDALKADLEPAGLSNSVVESMTKSMSVTANEAAKDGTKPLNEQSLLPQLRNVLTGYVQSHAVMQTRTASNETASDLANLSLSKFTKAAPTPEYMTALQDKSESMSPTLIKNVLSAKNPEQLFTAIKNITTSTRQAEKELNAVHKQGGNIPASHAILHILGQQIATLSPAEQDALRAQLKSDDMTQLRIAVTPNSEGRGMHPTHQNIASTINLLMENVEAMAVPFHGGTTSRQDVTRDDAQNWLLEATIKDTPLSVTGNAALKDLKSFDGAEQKALQTSMASNRMQAYFQNEMTKLSHDQLSFFEKDITRGLEIQLDNGTKVPNSVAEANDALARYVTGDQNSSYSALKGQDLAKVHILQSICNQNFEGICESSLLMSVQHFVGGDYEMELGKPSSQHANPNLVRNFSVTLDNNGLRIDYTRKDNFASAVSGDGTEELMLDSEKSHITHFASITLSPAELDRLSGQDWNALRNEDLPTMSMEETNRASDILQKDYQIQGGFRLNTHVHFEAAE